MDNYHWTGSGKEMDPNQRWDCWPTICHDRLFGNEEMIGSEHKQEQNTIAMERGGGVPSYTKDCEGGGKKGDVQGDVPGGSLGSQSGNRFVLNHQNPFWMHAGTGVNIIIFEI